MLAKFGLSMLAASCSKSGQAYVMNKEFIMKKKAKKTVRSMQQPKPFTPGLTKSEVRQHACAMFRDKLPAHPLTLNDWVLAEKDLVGDMEAEELAK
ncbi:MAG: hypothetical protein C5B50_17985 [Verrucomicrobia bacterium]|nr:MAG: hypothetical protein C5B50_17985 [Verrucomicrobiota bacterium]